MTKDNFDTYDFLINDEDEVMLLLYAREGTPSKSPSIEINTEEKTGYLARNDNDVISLKDIPNDILDSLQDADKLLVCELSQEKNEKDTKIIYAYEAEITDQLLVKQNRLKKLWLQQPLLRVGFCRESYILSEPRQ